MAISFVAAGTIASGTSGNITPALPAGIAANDILVLVVGAADNVTVTLPAAYTKKIELNSSTNCRLTVAWARATGSDSAPLVTHAAGNSIFGVIGAYRGCKTTGDPFTDAQSQANAAITTTITAPTITPLNGDFVIFAAAAGEGGTNNGNAQSLSGWSGSNPTLTERADYNDQGLGANLCPGGFADGPSTGGATGARTVTLATTAQATANSVGALLALTQDTVTAAGGVAANPRPPMANVPGVFNRSPVAHPPLWGGVTVYLDSPAGQINLSGSKTEAASIADSGAGLIRLSGSKIEAASIADSAAGKITLGGAKTESASIADSGAGKITLGGGSSNTLVFGDSLAGQIRFSGARSDGLLFLDTASGTIRFTGSSRESASIADSAAGKITLGGTSTESFISGTGTSYTDSQAGQIRLSGQVVRTGEYQTPTQSPGFFTDRRGRWGRQDHGRDIFWDGKE